jgi:hypothetical protein
MTADQHDREVFAPRPLPRTAQVQRIPHGWTVTVTDPQHVWFDDPITLPLTDLADWLAASEHIITMWPGTSVSVGDPHRYDLGTDSWVPWTVAP